MTIKYIVPGAKRKELAKCIADWLGVDVKYLGAPTFTYEIDYFTVDKTGTLSFDNRADSEVIERLLEHLYDEGFEFEEPTPTQNTDEDATEIPEPTIGGITISVPLDSAAVGTLTSLLESKESLIKKALGVSDISIKVEDDKITFPWFTVDSSVDDVDAYKHFIVALCKMSKQLKRVNHTAEKTVDNEKYTFRCFLLRLGFIGDEYKAIRKILLRNLEGSSAFKGDKKDEVTQ